MNLNWRSCRTSILRKRRGNHKNEVRWYGHVLRRDNHSVLRAALDLEVSGKKKRGRPKKAWKKQVEEETEKSGLKEEDALNRAKWRDGVQAIAEGMG